jgi:hypothetical protein
MFIFLIVSIIYFRMESEGQNETACGNMFSSDDIRSCIVIDIEINWSYCKLLDWATKQLKCSSGTSI